MLFLQECVPAKPAWDLKRNIRQLMNCRGPTTGCRAWLRTLTSSHLPPLHLFLTSSYLPTTRPQKHLLASGVFRMTRPLFPDLCQPTSTTSYQFSRLGISQLNRVSLDTFTGFPWHLKSTNQHCRIASSKYFQICRPSADDERGIRHCRRNRRSGYLLVPSSVPYVMQRNFNEN